ncbi:MAG: glycoside hydrolase family 43 protein [Treponema sp.]|jgi:alpha-N-arabinofuranosidase|nr:glycoside hydrolase family 43 protein [Treponema sp.]
MYTYHNPVIPGLNPDPSVCRDGEDFYLVTSSFEFFPGVPIYHSRNLVNWRLIGYCLTRNEQVPLAGCKSSTGIYAPTLRKHDGVFYMTTTNVSGGGNFIVHADTINGPWSDPVWIDSGADSRDAGIDPSLLFFNEKAYFCATGKDGDRQGVFLSEIDPLTGQIFSPARLISYGTGGRFPEAPHIYFIDGWFYLTLAEGGTEYGHMVTIQRSRAIYGPYESCPHNPVLSHRDRGGHPIQALGHADMFQDQYGAWWMVCLGIRPAGWAMLHNLGRETFLAPLRWENGWPVIAKGEGIELEMEGPLPAAPENVNLDITTDFSLPEIDRRWNYIRNPDAKRYVQKNGYLSITGDHQNLSTPGGNPAFIGMKQQSFRIEAITTLKAPEHGMAGMSAYYNEDYHYDIGLRRSADGSLHVFVNKRIHDLEVETFRQKISSNDSVSLRISADREYYYFAYQTENWIDAGRGLTAGLCTEATHTMTFTGVYIGIFASSGTGEFSEWKIRNI